MASHYPDAVILDRTSILSPIAYPASRTALLLIDYYASFDSHFPPGEFKAILAKAGPLRDWARKAGILVVHAMIDMRGSSGVLPTHKSAARLIGFQKIMMGTPGGEDEAAEVAYPGVDVAKDEEILVYRKPGTFSALLSAGLPETLEKKGIRSLIIGGVATSACVMSTVRAAADQGFIVTVAEDACGDPVPERHEMLAGKILLALAHVITVDELADAWEKA